MELIEKQSEQIKDLNEKNLISLSEFDIEK